MVADHTLALISNSMQSALSQTSLDVWQTLVSEITKRLFSQADEKIRKSNKKVDPDIVAADHVEAICEKASKVTDADLQDLWSTLLAKAALGENRYLKKEYYDTIEKMSPIEAIAIKLYFSEDFAQMDAHCGLDTDLAFPWDVGEERPDESVWEDAQRRHAYMCETLDDASLTLRDFRIARAGLVRLGVLSSRPTKARGSVVSDYGYGLLNTLQPDFDVPDYGEMLATIRVVPSEDMVRQGKFPLNDDGTMDVPMNEISLKRSPKFLP